MPITHSFVSAIPDSTAAQGAGKVIPNKWNDGHVISDGTYAAPGLAFTSEPTTGFHRPAAGSIASTVPLTVPSGTKGLGNAITGLSVGGDGYGLVQGAGTKSLFFAANGSTIFATGNLSGPEVRWVSDARVGWAFSTDVASTVDTGFARAAAGVVEVNNGTIGTLADLKARTLSTADGSAAAPANSFNNELGTGFFRYSSGTVGVTLNGVQKYIFNANYLGITRSVAMVWHAADFTGADTGIGRYAAGAVQVMQGYAGSPLADFYCQRVFVNGVDLALSRVAAGTLEINTGTAGSLANLNCSDINCARDASSGSLFFGSSGSNYLFFNSGRFYFQGGHLSSSSGSGIGIGVGNANPIAPLDVKVATNTHIIGNLTNTFPTIGAASDGLSAWVNLGVNGLNAFWPSYDNTLTCGGTSHRWSALWAATSTISTSDARLKTDVQDSALGLDFINHLHPVSYKWKNGGNEVKRVQDGVEFIPGSETIHGVKIPPSTQPKYKDVITPMPGVRTHWGLIAQEVKQALNASGVADFAGYVQTDVKNAESVLGLRYEEFIGPLIKAVQELSAQVKELQARLK